MKTGFLTLINYLVLVALTGCQEITPLSPKELDAKLESITKCQPPPIEKNIIGTWRFEATHGAAENSVRYGTVTFDQQGRMIDPDHLIEAFVGDEPVLRQEYKANVRKNLIGKEEDYLEIISYSKNGRRWNYFLPMRNECNLINLVENSGTNERNGIYLKRM